MRFFLLLCVFVPQIWGLEVTPIRATALKDIGLRIINGDEAVLGQLPWQVGIKGRASWGGYFCGGSLIGEEWVLTAGHCIDGAISATIYTNTTKISNSNRVVSQAAEFILHEKFNSITLNNDIGLIRLKKPLKFNDNTKPIALAIREPPIGTNVTVSGWGVTRDSDIYTSDILYYTTIDIIDNAECARIFGNSVITDSVICANPGNPHTSPCQGDSGAPVVVLDSCGKPVQIGVFSFTNGVGCEYPYPSGNSRVAYYRDWINLASISIIVLTVMLLLVILTFLYHFTPISGSWVRIVNGEEAQDGQFPWQVAIMGKSAAIPRYLCGGALISDQWVLTAGHCVDGAISAKIYSGSARLSANNKTTSEAAEFIRHEQFDAIYLNNDIGLIKLKEAVTIDEYTKPIVLAETELEDSTNVTVSGWGQISDSDKNPTSDILNYITIPTISNDKCKVYYGGTIVLPSLVCTSGGNPIKSPCLGDSGGPVVTNPDTNPLHVAIFSFVNGYGCEMDYPAGYTRTAYYRDWIREKTGI
ncbi:serine protease 53-like [Tribolium madens]|uniref:serine protease 53-like n=1 Tax=Tribolium madens TaxID=41895 RepID=UPI001CF75239|nr:serine protease 53-like [Tribolium madens]